MYKYKQKVQNKKIASSKRRNLLIIVIIITSVIGVWLFMNYRSQDNSNSTGDSINYEPATEVDKKDSENNKDRIVNEQKDKDGDTPPTNTNSDKKTVTPTITNTTGSVNAYVSGIFEEGGTCTAVFTKDGITKTKESVGFENVSYTQCAPINLESGFLTPGTWEVKLKYSSSTAEGISTAQNIEVI